MSNLINVEQDDWCDDISGEFADLIKGYDFNNDSRSYWDHEYNMKEVEIKNDSSEQNLIYSCISEIDGWRKNDNSI